MNREEIIKLIQERVDSPEREKMIQEIEPEEKGTYTTYLWAAGIVPEINTWYDGQLDVFFMQHSIFPNMKEERDRYTLSEESAKRLRKEVDEEILSQILRKLPKNKEWKGRVFHSISELEKILKELGVLEEYRKQVEQRKEDLKLLENPNLRKIKFGVQESWETGIVHWVLREEVPKEIFNILRKNGLFYHTPDAENEERFRGWCFRAGNPKTLEIALAKEGIGVL